MYIFFYLLHKESVCTVVLQCMQAGSREPDSAADLWRFDNNVFTLGCIRGAGDEDAVICKESPNSQISLASLNATREKKRAVYETRQCGFDREYDWGSDWVAASKRSLTARDLCRQPKTRFLYDEF